MPQTRAKNQGPLDAVGFNQLIPLAFPAVTLSSTTQNNGVVAARLFLPTTVKIYRVIAGLSGSVAGTVSLNVVAGTAAETGVTPTPDCDYAGQPAYPPAYATAGQSLFPTDQALTITADLATVLTPTSIATSPAGAPGNGWDALWGPGGTELTLRLPCSGATGLVQVTLLCKFYDPTYTKPMLSGFNPAVDIP